MTTAIRPTHPTDREASIARLRDLLHEGDTVFTILRHVSASGMTRSISPVIGKGGDIWDISGDVARVLDCRFDQKNGGVVVSGGGMDMGFHLVYQLSHRLFGGLSDHPGYALNHRWI